jgi:hypothetical protein
VFPGEGEMGIFAVGDTGRPTDLTGVVLAVRRGRKIARALQLHHSQEEIAPQEGVISDKKALQDVSGIANAEDLAIPRKNVDNIMILNEEESQAEAGRCLACGLICYKKSLSSQGFMG